MKKKSSDIDHLHAQDVFLNSYEQYANRPLRILIAFYKGHYGRLFASAICFAIKHSPLWIIPIITANIVDWVIDPSAYAPNYLWINIIIAAAVIVINLPMHMLFVKLYSTAIRHVEANLRGAIIRKLQQLSLSFHKDFKSGKMQTKIIRDVENIEFLSQQMMNAVLAVTLSTIVILAIVISRSLLMATFFIVAIPVALLLVWFFRKHMRKKNSEFRVQIEETSARVAEMVEMIPVTKAHGLEDLEINKMDYQLSRVRQKGYFLDMMTALFGASSWVSLQLFQVGCLAFTGYLAYTQRISGGEIVLYFSFFAQLLNQMAHILHVYPVMAKGTESIRSVGEILLAHDIEDKGGDIELSPLQGAYVFDHVDYSYSDGDAPALKDFSLNVRPGECIALVGASGCGKTTLLNLLIGFGLPQKGHLTIDGYDIQKLNLQAYRRQIAVVPQQTLLFSGTIRDNITYGLPEVSDDRLFAALKAAHLLPVIRQLPEGLDTSIGEHGSKLSGGQRQRIAIARALIRDPKVILLDEATSALDVQSERAIQSAMNNLVLGRTTFISAHRLSTIRDAHRIVVIDDGRLVEVGSFQELLLKKGAFYDLYQAQQTLAPEEI